MKYEFTCHKCRDTFECISATNKKRYCDDCLAGITQLRNKLNQKAWRERQAVKTKGGSR